MLTDIVSKGGNLLLNVGPRGVDAQIPDAQLTRLAWLGEWVPAHADAIFASRPWITAGTTTVEGDSLRYTARDDCVYAFVGKVTGSTTLPDVRATPTTSVTTLDGSPLSWSESPRGISIAAGRPTEPPRPTVFALHRVTARHLSSTR